MQKYAAMLMFQFRVDTPDQKPKKRVCEKRIINFQENTPDSAYEFAVNYGKECEFDYENDDGNTVFFEFIGIIDLMVLGAECGDLDVWYDVVEHLEPMERKDKFVPSKNKLSAFKTG